MDFFALNNGRTYPNTGKQGREADDYERHINESKLLGTNEAGKDDQNDHLDDILQSGSRECPQKALAGSVGQASFRHVIIRFGWHKR